MFESYKKRITDFLLKPVERYLFPWIYLTILSTIPGVCGLFLFSDYTLSNFFKGLFCDAFIIYFLLLVISTIQDFSEKLSVIIKWLLSFLISLMTAFSLSINILFSSHNLHFILLMIFETSAEEAADFLSVYKWVVFFGLFVICGMIFLFFLLMKHAEKQTCSILQKHGKLPFVFSLCILFSFVVFFAKCHHYGQFCEYRHLTLKLIKDYHVKNIVSETNSSVCFDTCAFTSSNIILVIGESFNKYHSNLYGYNKITSPLLSKEDNLVCFSNVVSPINFTYGSFSHFLSLASVEQECIWHDAPLFPYIFKKAGYNVLWWENQTSTCSYIDVTKNPFFNKTNVRKYVYDEELMDEYCQRRVEVEKDSNNLIMFHLIGMHYDYTNRFLPTRVKFQPKDYLDRKELNDEERLTVSNYDNAVVYNDSIVSNIIEMYRDKDAVIIYFSDHGEEINDYRSFDSRSAICDNNMAGWMHCQLDVPFIIFMTDVYREKHPSVVSKIERSVDRPFMIDDLPHLLYDLAGLKDKWYDPKRSVINDSFNVSRKRMVTDMYERTMWNYDSICSSNESWHLGWER